MVVLLPCPRCERHVRADGASCPFCDIPLPPREVKIRYVPRSSRAAFAAFGTAIVVGCGSNVTIMGDESSDGGAPPIDRTVASSSSTVGGGGVGGEGGMGGNAGDDNEGGVGSIGLMYGAPAVGGFQPIGGSGGEGGDGGDGGNQVPAYGTPVIPDP